MFNNIDIMQIAMHQSALDLNCDKEDFLRKENVIVCSEWKYYKDPFACHFVSYGNNIVASVKEEYKTVIKEYLEKFEWYYCFETPNMHWLNDRMSKYGQKVCCMSEYFLPDMNRIKVLPCDYKIKLLYQNDFTDLYLPQWSNALCEERKELDILGVGAYERDKLIGLAACSEDFDDMWQIGIDVLPEYRKKGIASALTSRLAMEILERNKVPFYCCAWSNIPSAKNAIKSGFVPAWVEMTVEPVELIDNMNQKTQKGDV